MKIISVVGARPNFMKIAPFIKAIEEHNANIPSSLRPSVPLVSSVSQVLQSLRLSVPQSQK